MDDPADGILPDGCYFGVSGFLGFVASGTMMPVFGSVVEAGCAPGESIFSGARLVLVGVVEDSCADAQPKAMTAPTINAATNFQFMTNLPAPRTIRRGECGRTWHAVRGPVDLILYG
jgi:hypothetical protein